jgi:putative ABC transport system permease protein
LSNLLPFITTSLRLALAQLVRHKTRSFLTLLGILIGVGAVMTIVSLGEGLRNFFTNSVAAGASADIVYIMPDMPITPGYIGAVEKPFKNRDAEMIRTSDHVIEVIPGNIINATIKHGWRSANVLLQMVPHEYFPIDNFKLDRGRLYSEAEERGRAMVCVVGSDVDKEIYDENEEILGTTLTVNGLRFRVVGELKSRSALEGGGDANKMVFVPLQTGQDRIVGNEDIYWMAVKVRDSNELALAKEDIATRLRVSRRIRSGKDDDFDISTPEDWAAFANGFVNVLITVFGVVAVIALIVGGIGVMNIMLVSVRERTREIGLRKALGATRSIIAWQFLVESMTLTVVGGLLGILAGWGLGGVVTLILKFSFDISWTPFVPLNWVLVVLGTSISLGLLFGVYPAFRAGNLDPIVALRYE